MKKFRVEITETLKRAVIVEATDADAAEELVHDLYDNCEIVLGGDDFESNAFHVHQEFDENIEPDYVEGIDPADSHEEDDNESC